ncbi:MAG: hypothetical protein RL208_499 [Pseudomonadota bacterium]|jgi:tRNA(Ile)-lysidine synthase
MIDYDFITDFEIKLQINLNEIFIKIKQNFTQQTPIAVAVSGGVDSLALVISLKRIGFSSLYAIIVNHNLRQNSVTEAENVSKLLHSFEIENTILNWDGIFKNNMEEEARNARYELLINECKAKKINYVALGHHLNDQVETFFLNLERGSGVDGLCCMPQSLVKNEICFLRPFLNFKKRDIVRYLTILNIKWFEDETNKNTDLKRNLIRSILQSIADKELVAERVFTTVSFMQEAKEVLDGVINIAYEKACFFEDNLCQISISLLAQEKVYVRKAILSKVLQKMQCSKTKPRLDDVLKVLDFINNDDNVEILFNKLKLHKKNGYLIILKSDDKTL